MAGEHSILSDPWRLPQAWSATMPEKSAYETGARKYPAQTGPDPSDAFSQDAAGNKPPRKGQGLADQGLAEKTRRERKDPRRAGKKEGSPEPDHVVPSPRDTREAPAPNPNGR
jgi:hypothetical protein